jgi:hypothetical protein
MRRTDGAPDDKTVDIPDDAIIYGIGLLAFHQQRGPLPPQF